MWNNAFYRKIVFCSIIRKNQLSEPPMFPISSDNRRSTALPQAAVLPKSDAGSDIIKPASSFVIQNRQTSCSMRCPMYGAHY